MVKFLAHPLTPQLLFSAAFSTLLVAYPLAGAAPSTEFEFLGMFGWSLLLVVWIITDARRRITPCFEFGYLCGIFLPLAVPWYCLWSRGWRGMLTLLALVSLWLAP